MTEIGLKASTFEPDIKVISFIYMKSDGKQNGYLRSTDLVLIIVPAIFKAPPQTLSFSGENFLHFPLFREAMNDTAETKIIKIESY